MSTLARLIKKDRGSYTNTSNLVIRDDRLHWNSRGIFVYLWSQANEWHFYVKEIVKHSPGGETELRNALKELEKYGYLERKHRHDNSGSFDGMDWILSDTGGLNHHAENPTDGEIKQNPSKKSDLPNDGEIKQNPSKKSDLPSDGKPIGWKTHRMDNRTLRNTNNKNYQQQELTNTSKNKINSSSKDERVPYSEIIDYLNQQTKQALRPTTKAYRKLIRARWGEGYKLQDFKTVIDNKKKEWQGTKFWNFMTPKTLFASGHFNTYLNANKLEANSNRGGGFNIDEEAQKKFFEQIDGNDLPF